ADDIQGAAVPGAPRAIAEHGDRLRSADTVLIRREATAERHSDAEEAEVIAADEVQRRLGTGGLTVEPHLFRAGNEGAAEGMSVVAQVPVFRQRKSTIALKVARGEKADHAPRVADGPGAE